MSTRGFAFLGFKLLGLWLLASAAIGAASMPCLWDRTPDEVRVGTVVLMFLPSLVALGIGGPLWFSADWFASRAFPASNGDGGASAKLRAEPVFALAASIIGLLFVAEGLPALSSSIYLFGTSLQTGVLGVDESRQRLIWDSAAKANVVDGLTRVLVGLVLLAGPARLAAAVVRVKKEFGGSLLEEGKSDQG